ncbi:MAG: hypothetical protein IK012_08050 [Fibrobacter sp.]|uniref:hypothetical protein n=1 Tax=Fibrobacter sp. TaxID=35828 RepID=UPI0025C31515|nr:hypothetical protein [Fibrobacter sp.]MBR4785189.1 hypothetical protein [Fibrobacter sp.]
MRIAAIAIISVVALSLSGCYLSRTHLHTTDGQSYQIYGNGVLLCEDSQDCSITQHGVPHRIELEAVKNGTVVGKKTIRRQITTESFLWGFATYFTSLYIYQAYPKNVYIPVDYNNEIVNGAITETKTVDWSKSPFENGNSAWDAVSQPENVPEKQPEPQVQVAPPVMPEY